MWTAPTGLPVDSAGCDAFDGPGDGPRRRPGGGEEEEAVSLSLATHDYVKLEVIPQRSAAAVPLARGDGAAVVTAARRRCDRDGPLCCLHCTPADFPDSSPWVHNRTWKDLNRAQSRIPTAVAARAAPPIGALPDVGGGRRIRRARVGRT